MRRLALLICLLFFAALAYSGDGYAQRKRTLVWKPRPTPSPTPIPITDPHENILIQLPDAIPDEPDSLEGLPPLKPTPTPTPTDDFFADLPDAKPTPPEWKYIGFASKEIMIYYNTRRITYPSPNVMRVWIKTRPLGKARERWIRKLDNEYRNYSDFAYTISQEEYDCVAVRARLLRATDYTRAAEVITSSDAPGNWHELVPDSIGEGVLQTVCRARR